MPTPRVWFDEDEIPAGTWVYVVEEEDPEENVMQFDAYEDCRNGNFGPVIEILLPDAETAEALISAEKTKRGE